MKIGMLLAVNAVIATVFGIGFAVASAQALAPYGVSINEGGLLVGRLFGSALIGYGMLTWLMRRSTDEAALRALSISLAVADAVGTLAALWAVVAGHVNALGWTTVAIYGLLCAGFTLFLVRRPAIAPA
jgi:hypothetical protein